MPNIYALIIFIASIAGIASIVLKKMPALARLPEPETAPGANFGARLKNWTKGRIEKVPGLNNISKDVFLQKLLSRVRVMTLKLEAKTGNYLQKLREQSQKKREEERNDNYWSDLKKLVKTRDYLKRRTAASDKPDSEPVTPANPVIQKITEIKPDDKTTRSKKKKTIMMF